MFAGINQPFTDRGKVGLESVGRMRKTDSSSSGAERDCSLTKSDVQDSGMGPILLNKTVACEQQIVGMMLLWEEEFRH